MEFVTRLMDGSISCDPKDRLGPVVSGSRDHSEAPIDLQEVPILRECSESQLRNVARIALVRDALAGTMLTRRGEPGDEFFLILDGSVNVHVSERKRVALGPGAFFGEMSLLDGGNRSATVVAETPVRLLVVNRENFGLLCREVPDLTQILSITLSRRLRQAEQAADAMVGDPAA